MATICSVVDIRADYHLVCCSSVSAAQSMRWREDSRWFVSFVFSVAIPSVECREPFSTSMERRRANWVTCGDYKIGRQICTSAEISVCHFHISYQIPLLRRFLLLILFGLRWWYHECCPLPRWQYLLTHKLAGRCKHKIHMYRYEYLYITCRLWYDHLNSGRIWDTYITRLDM